MDNKYGLGSSKVAVEIQKKDQGLECKSCKASNLHFCPTMEDHQAHEVMLNIQTHGKLSDPDRFTFGDCRTYMRTPNQMMEC